MSKANSGHFHGTFGNQVHRVSQMFSPKQGLADGQKFVIREHPTKYKQMSSKKLQELNDKVNNRTITREEYKRKEWQRRLTKRRNTAITKFWERERNLIKSGLPTTRNWSAEQIHDILSGKRPKYNGKTMASHHTYSVSRYPHLANRMEYIYPVTVHEHIHGWHGGNTKNSLPGVPIKYIKEF